LLTSCVQPPERDYVAVVGAHWLNSTGETIHEHCMIVVKEGKYTALGSQAMIPLPKTAVVVDGLGKFVVTGATAAAPAEIGQATLPKVGDAAAFVVLSADPRRDQSAFNQPVYRYFDGKGSGSLK
jgi:imidazolonepropionase-like amidohydrolase